MSRFISELRVLLNDLHFPTPDDPNHWKCMLNGTKPPEKFDKQLRMRLKPILPFNLQLTKLIENYICRVHKTLMDEMGHGLPLNKYFKGLKRLFRDKNNVLKEGFCQKKSHAKKGLEC